MVLWWCSVATTACTPTATPASPDFSALVMAGDSTFWIAPEGSGFALWRSPMMVTAMDSSIHELYVVDEDLSHEGAIFVGQRVYRRDLRTGDSVLVRHDTTVLAIAQRWLDRHPGARRLAPDEEPDVEPTTQVTTDLLLLDVVGPWLSWEGRVDIDAEGEVHTHLTRRGVVDLRTGLPVLLPDLVPGDDARALVLAAREQLRVTMDSIRQARDARAARAREIIPEFAFDSSSFELSDGPGRASVSFLVPGRGERAGGYALPLPELPLQSPALERQARGTRPVEADSARVAWAHEGWRVEARVTPDGERATLRVHHAAESWPLAEVPLPLRRLVVVSPPAADPALHRALRRAFAESGAGAAALPAHDAPGRATRQARTL